MKNRPLIVGISAAAAMLVLILDSQTALMGAQEGIKLCLVTVIPSLFPFILISIVLTSSLSGISIPFLRPLGKLCGIPKGAEAILISGFLGGYPAGAQSVAAAWKAGYLQKEDAQRMLAFCNNAGPSFLFGMAASVFSEKWIPWALWAIHIASAVLTSMLLPGKEASPTHMPSSAGQPVSQSLHAAVNIMANICGWVVVFRILIAFLRHWLLWMLPTEAQTAFIGILELSNGFCELVTISDSRLRFILCSGILACGGLCVAFQTRSVTTGLPLNFYVFGKVTQTVFSLLFSTAFVYSKFLHLVPAMLCFMLILRKKKNRSSIPAVVGV